MDRSSLLCLLLLGIFCCFALNGDIKATVNMPSVHPENDSVLDIPCAAPAYMANASFPNWIKIWRLNQSEIFDASRMTFINDNATLRLKSLKNDDSGLYECCLHAYAYEEFLCFLTQLVIPDNLMNTTVTAGDNKTIGSSFVQKIEQTVQADPPAWNVNLIDGDTLNARNENAYFIRIFDTNVTDVKCVKDGNMTASIKAGNNFPVELFSDILIPKYNASIHDGVYTCNGTAKMGNETETVQVSFDVIDSMDSNLHEQLIAPALASKYRNQAMAATIPLITLAISLYKLL